MLRHPVAVAVTVAAVMGFWIVVTVPLVAVFLIDGAFTFSEYAGALLEVLGFVVATTLAVAAVAFGLERLVRRAGRAGAVLAVLLPFAAGGAIVACVVAMFKLIDVPGAYVAVALTAYLLLLLAVYWPTLWLVHFAGLVLRRGIETIRRWIDRNRHPMSTRERKRSVGAGHAPVVDPEGLRSCANAPSSPP